MQRLGSLSAQLETGAAEDTAVRSWDTHPVLTWGFAEVEIF